METTIERVIFLQGIELFEDISSEQLAHLAGITKSFSADAGQSLFKEGDRSQSMFILINGNVHLLRDGELRKELTESVAIGVWGFFDGEERLMSATCKEESHFLVIDRIDFYDLLEDRVQLSQGLLKYFVKRIRKLTELSDAVV
ncbi:cyclic nucleotide-binding domain-containing protein [Fodinibius sp.]|uniref:Crp/Fnr family transcriptional regulator n=1 Tax=Fodinibius sp. TaxID=1872440 RepID=UPI002ACD6C2C|nr:cyclic nucleotide-binding domain-containing protein [Fodinibius sp.]MDZ7659018.1 cyclic nucleotide-binding domain-containing protein [Fodinibius sp.]